MWLVRLVPLRASDACDINIGMTLETYERWEPVADLPEQQLGTLNITSEGRNLFVTVHFDETKVRQPLRIDFGVIEAFKVYEEFSDCWRVPPQPMMSNRVLEQVVWPFQEVRHSNWVARVVKRNGAIGDHAWRHFVIVTLDVVLHVMTDAEVMAASG